MVAVFGFHFGDFLFDALEVGLFFGGHGVVLVFCEAAGFSALFQEVDGFECVGFFGVEDLEFAAAFADLFLLADFLDDGGVLFGFFECGAFEGFFAEDAAAAGGAVHARFFPLALH